MSTTPATYVPEDRFRKVRMSVVLMEALRSMVEQGSNDSKVTLDWGEPDAEGFYTPMLTITVIPAEEA